VAPKGYRKSDDRIKEEVCERLIEEGIDCGNVDVSIKEGLVTVTGEVNDRRDKHRIEEIAESVSGVSDVENQLRLAKREKRADEQGVARSGAQTGIGAAATKGASEGGAAGVGKR